jgi:quinol monooxygenase YgiN
MKWLSAIVAALAVGTWCMAESRHGAVQEKSAAEQLVERIRAIPGQDDKPFSLIVTLKVKRDRVEALAAAAKKAQGPSRAEPGCVRYEVQQNLEEPGEFVVLESWRNLKALQDHFATPHFAEFIKEIGSAVEEAPHLGIMKAVPAS